MKKIKIIICILFLISILSACNTKENLTITKYDLVNSFETLDEVILNRYSNLFGKIALNDDKTFVTDGNRSLMLAPTGDYIENQSKPRINFYVNEDIRDLRNYSHLCFDIFNESDKDVIFEIKFTFNDGFGSKMQTQAETIKINKKTKETVLKRLNVETLALIFNVAHLENIEFIFPHSAEAPILYLDNLRFRKRNDEYKEIEIILDEGEICSFDKDYQANSFLPFGYGNVDGITPELRINNNEEYSKAGKSLQMIAPRGKQKDSSWPYIKLSPKIVENIDLKKYSDEAKIVFDIYNDNEVGMNFSFDFHTKDENVWYKKTFNIKPKIWNRVELSFAELNSTSDIDYKVTENLSYINICYGEFADRDEQVFYFDSIRIES